MITIKEKMERKKKRKRRAGRGEKGAWREKKKDKNEV